MGCGTWGGEQLLGQHELPAPEHRRISRPIPEVVPPSRTCWAITSVRRVTANPLTSDVATIGEALARQCGEPPERALLIAPETGRITMASSNRLTRETGFLGPAMP